MGEEYIIVNILTNKVATNKIFPDFESAVKCANEMNEMRETFGEERAIEVRKLV